MLCASLDFPEWTGQTWSVSKLGVQLRLIVVVWSSLKLHPGVVGRVKGAACVLVVPSLWFPFEAYPCFRVRIPSLLT